TESKNVQDLNEIERDSLIKRFEMTFELANNVLKDFLQLQGETELFGSRDTFRTAFQRGIIKDGELWMEMIESRIKSVHTYDEEKAKELSKTIYENYIGLFKSLAVTLEKYSE
ncbi:MAG: HI0074 family nucleotidyltransferase substrate-binding subunit, partial [Bacteroidota bacterium]